MALKCKCVIKDKILSLCSKHDADIIIMGNAFLESDNGDIIHIGYFNHGIEVNRYDRLEFQDKFPNIKI